jgi:hypothetical protein
MVRYVAEHAPPAGGAEDAGVDGLVVGRVDGLAVGRVDGLELAGGVEISGQVLRYWVMPELSANGHRNWL